MHISRLLFGAVRGQLYIAKDEPVEANELAIATYMRKVIMTGNTYNAFVAEDPNRSLISFDTYHHY